MATDDSSQSPPDEGQGDPPQTPPKTSEDPSHAEKVAGQGAEDPDQMADEDRYRKGPGW